MKTDLIATALVLGVASSGALAHGDKHEEMMPGMKPGMMHGKSGDGHAEHAEAAGRPGDPGKVSRTVQVTMSDQMRFTPSTINVKRGETIKFAVRNAGQVKHEMVIGSLAELKEHAAMMRKMPEMEHAEPNQVTLDPGKTGELVWQFSKAGEFQYGCLIPGHFEAGMIGKITVKAK
jgi:uncharacterized cupredoxin-like copper-binding protein